VKFAHNPLLGVGRFAHKIFLYVHTTDRQANGLTDGRMQIYMPPHFVLGA